jgi:hypothetical protein
MFDTPQTKFVSIFALVTLITGSAITGVISGVANTLYFFIGFVVMSMIAILDIRCTLVGGCDFYGWLKTVLLAMSFTFSIVIFAYAIRLKRAENSIVNEIPAGPPSGSA